MKIQDLLARILVSMTSGMAYIAEEVINYTLSPIIGGLWKKEQLKFLFITRNKVLNC